MYYFSNADDDEYILYIYLSSIQYMLNILHAELDTLVVKPSPPHAWLSATRPATQYDITQ